MRRSLSKFAVILLSFGMVASGLLSGRVVCTANRGGEQHVAIETRHGVCPSVISPTLNFDGGSGLVRDDAGNCRDFELKIDAGASTHPLSISAAFHSAAFLPVWAGAACLDPSLEARWADSNRPAPPPGCLRSAVLLI